MWADNGHSWLRERLDLRGSRAAALLDLAEMLKAGVTTVADFFSMQRRLPRERLAVIEAARNLRIRLVFARAMYDWTGVPLDRRGRPDPDR